MPLALAPLGKSFKITQIRTDEKVKRHLESLGLGAGAEVSAVSDSGGDVILQVKGGRVAINKGLAMKITVVGA